MNAVDLCVINNNAYRFKHSCYFKLYFLEVFLPWVFLFLLMPQISGFHLTITQMFLKAIKIKLVQMELSKMNVHTRWPLI